MDLILPTPTIVTSHQAEQAVALLNEFATSPDVLADGADVLTMKSLMSRAKGLRQAVDAVRKEWKAPVAKLLADIEAAANRVIEPMKNIEAACKVALGVYENGRIREQAAAILAMPVEEGRSTPDFSQAVAAPVQPKVHTTTRTEYVVVDEALVPREFLTVDLPKVKAHILAGGGNVPGVEVRIYKDVVNRG